MCSVARSVADSAPSKRLLVTGGAGYIGSTLVPGLLGLGHRVTVLDAFFFGREPLEAVAKHRRLELIAADIRDRPTVRAVLARGEFDAVIHLAAISNDPSSELDPELTRSVNRSALEAVMADSKEAGVGRFIYASSASVYGLKDTPDVTEDLPLEPMTLYARYKAEGEEVLSSLIEDRFVGVSVRAATVCGYSPRLRLDLTINILTHFALTRGFIRVFGGEQMRPNVHVEDLADLYATLVDAEAEKIQGQSFNVSCRNSSVIELAELVRSQVDPELPIEIVPTDDNRSYCLSAAKLERELGFVPKRTLDDAVASLARAYSAGAVADPSASIYRNVEWMKQHRDAWIEWQGATV